PVVGLVATPCHPKGLGDRSFGRAHLSRLFGPPSRRGAATTGRRPVRPSVLYRPPARPPKEVPGLPRPGIGAAMGSRGSPDDRIRAFQMALDGLVEALGSRAGSRVHHPEHTTPTGAA